MEEVQLSCAAGQADLAALRRDLARPGSTRCKSHWLILIFMQACCTRQIDVPRSQAGLNCSARSTAGPVRLSRLSASDLTQYLSAVCVQSV